MTDHAAPESALDPAEPAPISPNRQAWDRFRRNRPALLAAAALLLIAAVVCLEPLFGSGSATTLSDAQYRPPDARHWFGTDVHGRDLWNRVCAGTRVSILVGAVGAVVSLIIGATWGMVAGYLGGRWDAILMRVVDILYSMPSIVFVIVLITTLESYLKDWLDRFGSSEWGGLARLLFLFAGLGAVSWLTMARIVRGQVLVLRNRPFVEASRVLGASHLRILFVHILPNVWGVIIVYLTMTVPGIILYESFLSYLGLGIQPPQASLGSLLAEGAAGLNPIRNYWWMIVCPGAVLAAILIGLNFLGDGLRDALDARA